MYKYIASVLWCLVSIGSLAQSNEIEHVLEAIKLNNMEIKALRASLEEERLNTKSKNNLPDPEASFYYLPFGTHNSGDYSEFEISQSFEFPTVYFARKKWINQKERQLLMQFDKLSNSILFKAKIYCLELIYLNKQIQIGQERSLQAKKILNQTQELFKKEQIGILALNKAKITWLQNEFSIEQLEQKHKNSMIALQQLNGGDMLMLHQDEYLQPLEINSFEDLWQEKLEEEPVLLELKENELASLQLIQVNKNKGLPDLMIGYNYQGVSEANYSGIYGGLSIPLWNNRNKVKTAQAQYQSWQYKLSDKTSLLQSEFYEQYNNYQFLLNKFRDFKATLAGLSSDQLLLQAYKLGEISYMEYYMELQFYRQAFDKMLEIEFETIRLNAEILKHKL